jgi:hypothetical protein
MVIKLHLPAEFGEVARALRFERCGGFARRGVTQRVERLKTREVAARWERRWPGAGRYASKRPARGTERQARH